MAPRKNAKTEAVRALWSLAVDGVVKQKIGTCGGIALLVGLTQNGDHLQMEAAAGVLKLLVLSGPNENDRRFVVADGAKALANALRVSDAAAEGVRTQALGRYTRHIKVLLTMVQESNCATSGAVPDQCEKALEMIKNVSLDEPSHGKLVDVGAIQVLVPILRPGIQQMQECATTTLWNLATQQEIKCQIVQCGGVDPLLALIRSTSGCSLVLKDRAAALIRSLCKGKEIATQVAELGGIQALVALLRSGSSEDTKVKVNACGALCNLALVPENAATITVTGGTAALMGAPKSSQENSNSNSSNNSNTELRSLTLGIGDRVAQAEGASRQCLVELVGQ